MPERFMLYCAANQAIPHTPGGKTMRARYIAVLGCCLLATACTEKTSITTDATALTGQAQSLVSCPSTSAIESMIIAVFPSGGDRSSALSRFNQVVKLTGPKKPGPDTASARTHALDLINFIVAK